MKKIFLVCSLLLLFLGGCGSASSDTFVFQINAPIESLDLAKCSYNQTFQLFTDIYSTLLEVNAEGELVNSLATDIQKSEDGLTYTIKLREDAKWVDNNGQEKGNVTAQDFVFTWQRMVNPDTGAQYAFIFEPLKNAIAIENGEMEPSELGVKAIDDYTLEITLETPTPYFESLLAFGSYGVMPKAASAEYGDDFATSAETMWYSGPFYLTDYAPDAETHLTKNELYYDAQNVALNNITYRVIEDASSRYNAFKSGEVDYAELLNPTDIEDAKANGTLDPRLTGYSYYLAINQTEGASTSDENLKKALALGFDREGIEGTAYGFNDPLEYIIPKDFTPIGYDGEEYRDYAEDSLITYNKEEADKYFDKYMEENGIADRSDIVIEYLCEDQTDKQKLAEVIKAHYKQEFGINVEINALPFEQYVDARNKGDFDITVSAWGPDFADPSTYLALWQSSSIGGTNYPRYSNEEYDKLYTKAINETDVEKRFEDFAELEQKVVNDSAVVPFYQLTKNLVISDEYNVPTHLFLLISHKYVTVNE